MASWIKKYKSVEQTRLVGDDSGGRAFEGHLGEKNLKQEEGGGAEGGGSHFSTSLRTNSRGEGRTRTSSREDERCGFPNWSAKRGI